jgi:hypothetical protein
LVITIIIHSHDASSVPIIILEGAVTKATGSFSTRALFGRRGTESPEAIKDRHVARLGLTLVSRASENFSKVLLGNIGLVYFWCSRHAIIEVEKFFARVGILVRVDITLHLPADVDIHACDK